MDSAQRLTSDINEQLRLLSFRFEEDDQKQALTIDPYKPSYYSLTAGGTVQGSSPRWMRLKHRDGQIHEPGMIAILKALNAYTDSISTVFDIGALYGNFSAICLTMFDDAVVYAFEMNPIAFAAMEENLALNEHLDVSRFKACHCAMSDTSEMNKAVRIRNRALVTSEAPLSKQFETVVVWPIRQMFRGKFGRRFESFNIDFWSIDDFCENAGARPDLIKIDVEGFQAKIVPGGRSTFAAGKPFVLLEFDAPDEVNAQGVSNRQIAKILFDLGYKLIWGDHRDPEGHFAPLDLSGWNSRHEENSLGFFYHEDRLKL
jgi:FkbM family methyltransferase